MRSRLFALPLVLLLALGAGGCLQTIGNVVRGAATTIVNPLGAVDIYRSKNVYVAAQELVDEYQVRCFGSQLPPYPVTFARISADPVLSDLCRHRVSRYRAMKSADAKAYAAIRSAETFIANNPSGNAASYLSAAWKAVNDFKALAGN